MTRARVHGWVRMEKLRHRRVHGEATECVMFIGRKRNACCSSGANRLDRTADGNEAWRTAERRKQPCAQPATVKMGSCSSGGVSCAAKRRKRTFYGRYGVLLIGRGVAYRKTEETYLCWSATVETGVLFIERGVAYRKTGLHGILFISTVDCLHGLLFIHRRPPPSSTCDCSSTGSCTCLWLGWNEETASSSCSWGGNGTRSVHREPTGLDGT